MNITLIYPLLSKERSKIDENKQYWPPLGLAYLSAYLERGGHSVKIIDRDVILRQNNIDFEGADNNTLRLIKEFDTDIVGISMTTPNFSDVVNVLSFIKKANPDILTVIGGPHCTGEPTLTMEICKEADILVKGEGEEILMELASGKDLAGINGIVYRDKDRNIKANPERALIEDIDSLPIPARHLLDMEFYLRPSRFTSRNLNLRTTSIFTARGCPFKCSYCAGPIMGRGKVRYHSPERVINELIELIEKYKVEAIYFAEDMFLSNKKRASYIFDLMNKKGINKKIVWMAQLSTNIVDEDYLQKMKEAGCVHVEYGFESGSQRVLGLMNKKSTVEENIRAAEITKKVGIRFQGNFIVGYPGEKEEDFDATIDFIKKVRPSNVSLNLFMPLPGTEVYKMIKNDKKDIIPWDEIGDPDTPHLNYADMEDGKFKELYDRARLKVVLPLNLSSFIKDNIKHPFRLLYVISSQFKGVLIKTFRSYRRLQSNIMLSIY